MGKSILSIIYYLLALLVITPYHLLNAQAQYNTLLKAEKAEADKDYDKAKSIYRSMIANASEVHDTTVAYAYSNMGHLFLYENKKDSAINSYYQGALFYKQFDDAFRQRNLLNAAAFASKMYKDYEQQKFYTELAVQVPGNPEIESIIASNNFAGILIRDGALDSAEVILMKNLEIVDSFGINSSSVWNTLGSLEKIRGNLPRAISHYTQCIEEYQKEFSLDKSPLNIANTYVSIARMFLELDNYEKAHEMLDHSKKIADTNNFKRHNRQLLRERGLIYIATNIDSALVYLHQYEKAIGPDASAINKFSVNNFLALVQIKMGNLSEAESRIRAAERIIDAVTKDDQKTIHYRVKGMHAFEKGNFKEAIAQYDVAYNLAVKTGREKNQIQLLKLQEKAYAGMGNLDKAYRLHKEYQEKQEAMTNLRSQQIIYELEGKFQKAQQEMEISQLTNSNQEKDLSIASKNRLLWTGFLGLIGISFMGWQSYRLYRNKKKSSQLLEEKNEIISEALSEKELLLKEIHHRVKNNLQVVSSLLSLQSDYIKDDSALSALNEGRNRVKSMALIHQNLYQEDNLTGIKVKEYFSKLVSGLFDSYNISKDKIHLNLDIQEQIVDVDTIIPLGLIANELISNALKYAFPGDQKGVINVGLHQSDNQLRLSVNDDGVGFDDSIINDDISSFGYQMIQAFCVKLNAQMDISSTSSGTKVLIVINNEA